MSSVAFRRAAFGDLEAIVGLLADDPIGSARENVGARLDPCYQAAFDAIASDPNQLLAVADRDGRVIGVVQLSFVPGLARRGMWRGQIEGVRISGTERGAGIGRAMLVWAIEECKKRGCGLVQLTSDKRRPDAHRFYAAFGFQATHEGYKLVL
jgi:GNAT superfamily N-acetyltransferase